MLPFVKKEAQAKELSRFGQLVSLIKLIIVCQRRHVYMILKDTEDDWLHRRREQPPNLVGDY